MVTHLTTNPLLRCLNRAERLGSLALTPPTIIAEKHKQYKQRQLVTYANVKIRRNEQLSHVQLLRLTETL